MTDNRSAREIAAENLKLLTTWIEEREAAGDWNDYLYQGKLNRSEIAAETGIGLSAFRQNPRVKETLEALEARLKTLGVIQPSKAAHQPSNEGASASEKAVDKMIMAAIGKAEARVKALEEQNASLKAEVASLRERLRRFEHLDDHLGRTGRLLAS